MYCQLNFVDYVYELFDFQHPFYINYTKNMRDIKASSPSACYAVKKTAAARHKISTVRPENTFYTKSADFDILKNIIAEYHHRRKYE